MPRGSSEDRVLRDVGRRIAELRTERGWTQEDFAERAGWSWKYAQRLESGGGMTLRTLVRVANALGVKPGELLEAPKSRAVRRGRPRKGRQPQIS